MAINKSKFKIESKLYFTADEKIFGPGIADLLKLIDEHNTLQKACKVMGMSYTKGWRIICKLEKQLGYKVIDATVGGNKGGTSKLTKEAKEILDYYKSIKSEVDKLLKKYN